MTRFFLISFIISSVFLMVYHLLLRREKMYRFNRFYLIATIVFSIVIPFVTIPVYVETEQVVTIPEIADKIFTNTIVTDEPAQQVFPIQSPELSPATPQVNYWPYIALLIYTLISVILITRFIFNIRHFYIVKKRSKTVRFKSATLVLAEGDILPHTFLNNIYLNKEHFEKLQIEPELLTHELTHVRQHHTLDILFIEVLKALMWFNPMLYLYKKAIQLNHEFLADEAVIQKHKDITGYQELLLTKATPAFNYALSSSINFSLTKKRFAMMTKTTHFAKAVTLKVLTALVTTGLVYVVCVKTVAHAKETLHKNKLIPSSPVEEVENSIAEDIIEKIVPEQELIPAITNTDTVAGDARRDEYFKGVHIIIEDQYRKVFINNPYEQLTQEQKRLYLNDVPAKKKASPPDDESYKFYTERKDAVFYIDDKKVSYEDVIKRDRKDFASSGFRANGERKPNGEFVQVFQMFFYTHDYFNKHIKHINDHYPDKTYKISILDKALDWKDTQTSKDVTGNKNSDGKSDLEISREKLEKEINAESYPRTKEIQQAFKDVSMQFPGGWDKFYEYFYSNLKTPPGESRKDMYIHFSVNTDGTVSDVKLSLEKNEKVKEAITKVLLNSPRWIPAQRDGQPLKMSTSIKVSFGENK